MSGQDTILIKNSKNTEFLVDEFLAFLEKKHGITRQDISLLIKNKAEQRHDLQVSGAIFRESKLSPLETVVRFLKDVNGLAYCDIAGILDRNDRTIWNAYTNSLKKNQQKLESVDSEIQIPISLFKDRKFSILEHVVSHLKQNYGLSYHEIAVLLGKDDRTVWTAYSRYKQKCK